MLCLSVSISCVASPFVFMSRPANVLLAESSAYVPGSRKLRVTGWSLDDLSEAYFPYKILCHPQLLVPGGCLFLREPQTGGLLVVFLRSHPKTAPGEKKKKPTAPRLVQCLLLPETRTHAGHLWCGSQVCRREGMAGSTGPARLAGEAPISLVLGLSATWAKFVFPEAFSFERRASR